MMRRRRHCSAIYTAPACASRVRRRVGFTVMELMIVVTLAGIVGGLSIGKLSAYMMQQRVAKAAFSLTNDLQQAFAVVGRIRRPVRIVIDTTRMQISITDRAQTTVIRRV